jgi:hypothetical protein
MEGWIKLYKKFKKWGWYDSSEMVHLFIHLLLSANHQDKEWRGMVIKRGQVVIGREKLSKTLGMSVRTLRTCMTRLKSTSEITTQTTNRFTIITLVKYDLYQYRDYKATSRKIGQATNKRPTSDQQATTTKEYKNIRNKEYDDKSSRLKITYRDMPISLEELNDGDITYEEEFAKTPKKYKGLTKAYARIAIKYLQLRGEGGNVLRYYPDIKELWSFAASAVKPENIEAEIMGRIEAYKKQQEAEGLDWALGGVVKNWNKILTNHKK